MGSMLVVQIGVSVSVRAEVRGKARGKRQRNKYFLCSGGGSTPEHDYVIRSRSRDRSFSAENRVRTRTSGCLVIIPAQHVFLLF